jgi:hypothetical protein
VSSCECGNEPLGYIKCYTTGGLSSGAQPIVRKLSITFFKDYLSGKLIPLLSSESFPLFLTTLSRRQRSCLFSFVEPRYLSLPVARAAKVVFLGRPI